MAEIPIEPAVRVGGDSGKPVSFYEPNSVTAKRYESAAARLWEIIENINNGGGADNSAIQPVNDGKSACSEMKLQKIKIGNHFSRLATTLALLDAGFKFRSQKCNH